MTRDTLRLVMIIAVLIFVLFGMTMCNAMIGPPNTKRVCDEMGGTMDGDICVLRVTE